MKKYLKRFFIIEITILILSISLVAQQEKSDTEYVLYTVSKTQDAKLLESIARGNEIYTDFCMQCHLPDGKGSPNVFPPLAGSDWLTNKRQESIYSIKYGLRGPIKVNGKTYNSAMTSLGLEDEEIADVMNYIMNSWGNTQKKMVTVEEVAGVKK
ncbi:mono/diheme cytochrome c family protein [Aquimarina sp. EL_43]|uniref:c-type cytochrome n=1 Tax=Aquimarina TaxID=290174 RepID=UPI00047078E2|nr:MULTISPECIES: cytochrome c [Aquimarina]MBG6128954.1 mono/diheme cytochrome c family protein [Aquimarina sp. EL_35]MBG6150018.1 mono/diheme cytochrome c family protein [Aquimarina sp. EL_32]MBG6167295.1 mono/diheme cytochrome c family protein [Aquimarina sp. EL_43]